MGVVARALRDAPSGHWVLRQTLHDVLMAHWPVSADALRAHVPLPLDTFGGHAWLTVSPFDVSDVRLRLWPRVPGADAYAALTVRTYVLLDKKPGVFYLSLDATNPVAVMLGRLARHQAYEHAWATLGSRGATQFFYSRRREDRDPPAQFSAHYGPAGPIYTADRGSLLDFLVERYWVYSEDRRGRFYRSEMYHRPWPLQDASARIAMSGLLPKGVNLPPVAPLLHYCRRLDVKVWPLERVAWERPVGRERMRRAEPPSLRP